MQDSGFGSVQERVDSAKQSLLEAYQKLDEIKQHAMNAQLYLSDTLQGAS